MAKETTAKKAKKRKKKIHEADMVTRRKARISFQTCGTEELKFCKAALLTHKLAESLGRSVWKIIPKEIRQRENGIPLLSIFRDDKNRQLILRCDRVKIYETITTDENGQATFQPVIL